MSPLGIFNVIVGALDCLGLAVGRRKETRRQRILAGVLYTLLLLLGIGVIVLVVRELYF